MISGAVLNGETMCAACIVENFGGGSRLPAPPDTVEWLTKLLDGCKFLPPNGTTRGMVGYGEMSPKQLASWLVDNGVGRALLDGGGPTT